MEVFDGKISSEVEILTTPQTYVGGVSESNLKG